MTGGMDLWIVGTFVGGLLFFGCWLALIVLAFRNQKAMWGVVMILLFPAVFWFAFFMHRIYAKWAIGMIGGIAMGLACLAMRANG